MRLVNSILLAAMGAILPAAAHGQCQTQKLTGSTATPGAQFGSAVSISGDWLVVGAYQDDEVQGNSGAAFIFHRTSQGWVETLKLKPADAQLGALFGNSVAIEGDVIAIGAPEDDMPGIANAGAVYVFERTGPTTWTQAAKLRASDPSYQATVGWTMAISNGRILAGAPYESHAGWNSGAAYVFERNTSAVWGQTAKIIASDSGVYDNFSSSLALAGNLALIGAGSADGAYVDMGAAYVFEDVGGSWFQRQKLIGSDTVASDYFGGSVATDGTHALIAGGGHPPYAGRIYAFELQGTTWVETQNFTASDTASNDSFGSSVAMAGDLAIIGAFGDSDSGSTSGSAYFFRRAGSSWVQLGKLLARDGVQYDLLGAYLAMQGDEALVGAYGSNNADGSAYLFRMAPSAMQYCSCGMGAPCFNVDSHGGCKNTTGQRAVLAASGSASVATDDLLLEVSHLPPSHSGLLFVGGASGQPVPFSEGVRCVSAGSSGLYRFPAHLADASGFISQSGIVSASQLFPPPGPIGAGDRRYFQFWYRDPGGACGGTTNYSNALMVVFGP